ncbi:MAG: hypothetical protein QOD41_4010, partial [Cryptosporangiaceae bacterium]|nr:hypothetical protein [Cryptosporangiaceae bacterium]
MSGRGSEPPEWALPSWDAVGPDPDEPTRPLAGRPGPGSGTGPTPSPGTGPAPSPGSAPGTFGIRILAVSEVTRAVRAAIRQDPRLVDLWVGGEI